MSIVFVALLTVGLASPVFESPHNKRAAPFYKPPINRDFSPPYRPAPAFRFQPYKSQTITDYWPSYGEQYFNGGTSFQTARLGGRHGYGSQPKPYF